MIFNLKLLEPLKELFYSKVFNIFDYKIFLFKKLKYYK